MKLIYVDEFKKEYPVTEEVFRNRHKRVSFSKSFGKDETDYNPYGYHVVQPTTRPEITVANPTLEYRENLPQLGEDGKYYESWYVHNVILAATAENRESILNNVKSALKNNVAAIRYEKEIGGIDVGGNWILTDRVSQSLVNSAYSAMKNGLINDTYWKAQTGWVLLTINELEPIAQAVASHVRHAFDVERQKCEEIDNLTTADAHLFNPTVGW